MFTDDRQALWWSLVAGIFFWCWREAGSPCDGPWWLGASSCTGDRQAVPVMIPGGWYCREGAVGALALLVLCWGAVGSPGLTGTVLGGCGEPWLHWYCAGGYGELWLCWYCAGGLWGALASLVLCWGAVWSPGFAGTVLGGCGEPWLCWYCAGGLWGALALLVLCWGAVGSPGFAGTVLGGLWGALASLVLCWGAVGSPGFAEKLRNKFLKFPECSNHSKYCFTSL